MSCQQKPTTKNLFMAEVIEATFQLRSTPPHQFTAEQVYDEFLILYPTTFNTFDEVKAQLVIGGQRGIFLVCENPPFSGNLFYSFNKNMASVNPKNREFGIPIIMDQVLSGSGFVTHTGPVSFNQGIKTSNNLSCDPQARLGIDVGFNNSGGFSGVNNSGCGHVP